VTEERTVAERRGTPARVSRPDPLDELKRSIPTDEESAWRAVRVTAALSPAERWRVFAEVQREMESLLGTRSPIVDESDGPFWRYWVDPAHGRPR